MITSPFPHPPVFPDGPHPRLMLCAGDLPRIRENIQNSPNYISPMFAAFCLT